MLILRLRQAECAVADGRLDEALEMAARSDVREHRRGQKLIGRLTRAFVRRGRDNLDNDRIQPALNDCNKAAKLAGDLPDVAKLRSCICKAIEQKRLKQKKVSLKVAQARAQIENGWLSVGENILGQAEHDDSGAGELLEQVAATRMQINEAAAKVEKALERGDIDEAVEIFRRADVSQNHNGKVARLRSKLKSLAAGRITDSINEGRIDSAQALRERIEPIAGEDARISELSLALEHCRQAGECVVDGRPRAAAVLLRKVGIICPSAKWLKTAISQVQQAAESLDEIAAGPLGLIAGTHEIFDRQLEVDSQMNDRVHPDKNAKCKAGAPNASADSALPGKFMLQIDGVGGFLVLRDAHVSVGPISSSARPDLGLVADPNLAVMEIERADDDYFLRSAETVYVNDAAVNEKLLANGDRIALSNRCRMKFNIPNPASATAVVDLSSARLSRADIRQVILMDREILIGPAQSDHIRTGLLTETVTVLARNGSLVCRTKTGGGRAGSSTAIAVGKQIRVGGISMVLTKFEE